MYLLFYEIHAKLSLLVCNSSRVGLFWPIQFVIVIVLFTTDCVPLVVVKQNKHKGPFCKNKLR